VIVDGKRQIAMSAQGTVAGLDGLPVSIRSAVEQALISHRVEVPPAIEGLAAKRDVLLGEPAAGQATELLEPVGAVVEEQNPTFRWKPAEGAEYQVKVYTSDFQQADESGWLKEAQWPSSVLLHRGTTYSWQVTVRRGGTEITAPAPPAPEARFQILDAASEADLAQLRTGGESHLVMGIAYARAGLLQQAEQELHASADRDSGSAAIEALLASLNSIQRRSK
jgi:hypothetical protein